MPFPDYETNWSKRVTFRIWNKSIISDILSKDVALIEGRTQFEGYLKEYNEKTAKSLNAHCLSDEHHADEEKVHVKDFRIATMKDFYLSKEQLRSVQGSFVSGKHFKEEQEIWNFINRLKETGLYDYMNSPAIFSKKRKGALNAKKRGERRIK